MSVAGGDDVGVDMRPLDINQGAHPAAPETVDADGASAARDFARLRETFHALLELDLAQRAEALRHADTQEPQLALELRALLAALDETDLLATPSAQTPARLGPFRLLRSLGRGGMGEVWLAERVEGGFEQHVALKRVRDAALSPELTRRFLRERQILARLVHPNIAHLVDGGFGDDGRPWLAMEYVEGERITTWCASRNLDAAARVRLFLPICDAVQFAHRNLIVHRDLKPANLMVDAGGRPKLLDFGIARLLDGDTADPTQTLAAMTPAYAAPEQRMGGAITTATDVFQLGVVLRELLAYEGGIRDHPKPGVQRGLAQVIAKATREAPVDRYASVAAFADDLHDWLEGRPLRSGIGSRRERLASALKQWRWPLALTATLLISLAIGAAIALREARVAKARERDARASFDALLGIIGSANPGRFAGREPLAGELLIDAAAQLRLDFAHDPALLHVALGEIGHGLLNLGRLTDAEAVLLEAHALLRRDPDASTRSELGLLKLLAVLQTEPSARARSRATAARIAEVAAADDAPPGLAMDTLASGAASAARVGESALARELVAQAERISDGSTATTVSERESFWRQRGHVAMALLDFPEAERAFVQSRRAQDSDAQEFSTLRRAELDVLMAEAALAVNNSTRARLALERARPVMYGEYPEGHLERAQFKLHEARLAILEHDSRRALEFATDAQAVIAASAGEANDRAIADAILRVATVLHDGCGPEVTGLQSAAFDLPRAGAERAWIEDQLRRACGPQAANMGADHSQPLANGAKPDAR